jgi:cell division protein FtsB
VLKFFLPPSPVGMAVILAVLAVSYITFTAGGSALKSLQLGGDEQQAQREVAELQQRYERLLVLRDYLQSDEYVESIARRVLGLVKPGETLVIVSSPEEPGAAASDEQSGSVDQPWWEVLFGP